MKSVLFHDLPLSALKTLKKKSVKKLSTACSFYPLFLPQKPAKTAGLRMPVVQINI
jgi:hypothetical protein